MAIEMKAEELRIGNFIEQGKVFEVKPYHVRVSYWHQHKQLDAMSLVKLDECEPIPLSEEVLLKCGFERSEIHENFYFIKLNDWTKIYVAFHEKQYVVELSVSKHSFCPKVNCLHQLQNLYCSLTGEELKVSI